MAVAQAEGTSSNRKGGKFGSCPKFSPLYYILHHSGDSSGVNLESEFRRRYEMRLEIRACSVESNTLIFVPDACSYTKHNPRPFQNQL